MNKDKPLHADKPRKRKKHKLNGNAYIQVVGMNKLQNGLLLSFLKEKTGFNGTCQKKLKYITPVRKKGPELPQFMLLDWTGVDGESLWDDINSWRALNSGECYFALCNVDPKMEIENLALANNIQGLFYENNPLKFIPKGIYAILNGELWYPRRTLINCILENSSSNNCINTNAAEKLTSREREILILIASGISNKEIAGKLFISGHTVKTHIYNMYRKINTDSRFQAALWASKNL